MFGSPARAGSVRAAPVFEESSALHTLAVQDLGELRCSWKPVGGHTSRTFECVLRIQLVQPLCGN